MKTSAESMSWYKKVDETWKSVGVDPDVWKSTPADYKIVCKTIKALWKKEMGTKFPYTLKEVSGNRHTWSIDRKTLSTHFKDATIVKRSSSFIKDLPFFKAA